VSNDGQDSPVALVTGVGRSVGIGASVVERLASSGWTVAAAGWQAYDERMPWGADSRRISHFEVDLEAPAAPAELISQVTAKLGPIRALVLCHCESVDSDLFSTSVESFDRHMAVNARSTWLLIKAFAEGFEDPVGSGRIVAITSDAVVGNTPYGASKGALDRIVLASAVELAGIGVTANVINPGATDTGWMTAAIERAVLERNIQSRIGRPIDCANLVDFLVSAEGQWINGQLLYSDGGLAP